MRIQPRSRQPKHKAHYATLLIRSGLLVLLGSLAPHLLLRKVATGQTLLFMVICRRFGLFRGPPVAKIAGSFGWPCKSGGHKEWWSVKDREKKFILRGLYGKICRWCDASVLVLSGSTTSTCPLCSAYHLSW